MPNWCQNAVSIRHEDPTKIQALAAAMREAQFLGTVIPVPQDLLETIAGHYNDEQTQKDLEIAQAYNIKTYGFANWYDFCVSRWGTKWEVDCHSVEVSEDGCEINAVFDSAWSPPVGVYQALLDQNFAVVGRYYEPGMAFAGEWNNGFDNSYDLSDLKSHEVREMIGEDLDDALAISESMAMWEEDCEDD